jgi:tetratricopeptide (TPR) repeat protein
LVAPAPLQPLNFQRRILNDLTFSDRIINATLSYGRYLAQMVWPLRLAPFYPLSQVFPIWPAVGTGLLLLAATLLALRAARTRPYLVFGWIWYLVTLLPVIGLIQVGHQSHADRYTYVPLIGVFALLVWGAYDLTRQWRFQPLILSALALAVTLPCIALTRRQIHYWKNSETLFRHAIAVTENNELAYDILGTLLVREGHLDEGIPCLQAALKLAPAYARAHNDLGAALGQKGREDEAIVEFQEALRLNPKLAEAHRNLGFALEKQGHLAEAIGQFSAAANFEPDFAEAHRNLGVALGKQGRLAEAVKSLEEAVRLAPADAEAQSSLGITLGKLGRLDEAISHLQAALKLNPNNAEAHCNLGVALGAKGQLDAAISHLQAALKLKPSYADAQNNLRTALDLKSGSPGQYGTSPNP